MNIPTLQGIVGKIDTLLEERGITLPVCEHGPLNRRKMNGGGEVCDCGEEFLPDGDGDND